MCSKRSLNSERSNLKNYCAKECQSANSNWFKKGGGDVCAIAITIQYTLEDKEHLGVEVMLVLQSLPRLYKLMEFLQKCSNQSINQTLYQLQTWKEEYIILIYQERNDQSNFNFFILF